MPDSSAEMHGELGSPLVLAVRSIEGEDCEVDRAQRKARVRSLCNEPPREDAPTSLSGPIPLTVVSQHDFSGRPWTCAGQGQQLQQHELGRFDAFLPPAELSEGEERCAAALCRNGCGGRLYSLLYIALPEGVGGGGRCSSEHARSHARLAHLHGREGAAKGRRVGRERMCV